MSKSKISLNVVPMCKCHEPHIQSLNDYCEQEYAKNRDVTKAEIIGTLEMIKYKLMR